MTTEDALGVKAWMREPVILFHFFRWPMIAPPAAIAVAPSDAAAGGMQIIMDLDTTRLGRRHGRCQLKWSGAIVMFNSRS